MKTTATYQNSFLSKLLDNYINYVVVKKSYKVLFMQRNQQKFKMPKVELC